MKMFVWCLFFTSASCQLNESRKQYAGKSIVETIRCASPKKIVLSRRFIPDDDTTASVSLSITLVAKFSVSFQF